MIRTDPSRHPGRLLVTAALAALLLACGGEPDGGELDLRRGDDALVSGREVRLTDSIAGDLMATGGSVHFAGATGGDYLGAGGEQRIVGRIGGSVRAAGGDVRVGARVARNATVAGGNIVLDEESVVEGNAYLAGGAVRVNGSIGRELQATGGSIVIDGPVGGTAQVTARELRVGPRAVISGDLRHRVRPENVRIDPGASIAGEVVALPARDWSRAWLWLRIAFALGFLVAGAAAVALFPGTVAAASATLRERPGIAAIVGIAAFILLPLAAALIAATMIGLPLAVIAILVWLILAYLGRTIPAIWIGQRFLGPQMEPGRRDLVLSFLIGALILLLVGAIPRVGPFITLVVTLFGFGALLLRMSERERTTISP